MGYLQNAPTYLVTPTFDGSGHGLHPSVLDFGSGLIKTGAISWNGYRYWMAFTPYYLGQNLYELPSLLCSNDNETWVVPDGLKSIRGTHDAPSVGYGNPLLYQTYYAPSRLGDVSNFFNDTHMNYVEETDELWIHFNRVYRDLGTTPYTYLEGTGTQLLKINSDLEVSVFECANSGQTFPTNVNPTQTGDAFQLHVTLYNGGTWYGYRYAQAIYNGSAHWVIHRQTSLDGLNWSPFSSAAVPSEPHQWELYETPMRIQGHWSATLREDGNTVDVVSLLVPLDNPSNLAESTYGFARTYLDDPERWEYPLGTAPIMLSGASGSWDDALYRPSFTIRNNKINLWYSANGVDGRRIGFTSGYLPLSDEPTEPTKPFFAGDQVVTKFYLGDEEVNLKAGG